MLRPTLNEIIAGLQRSVIETLSPELSSPYALSQAVTAAGVLGYLSYAMVPTPEFDRQETADLSATLGKITGQPKSASTSRKEMEAAISELASKMVLGKLSDGDSAELRGYLRRHLDRMRTLLAPGLTVLGR